MKIFAKIIKLDTTLLLNKASSQLETSDLILNYLTLQTTNELWQECVVDASAKTVYKVNKH